MKPLQHEYLAVKQVCPNQVSVLFFWLKKLFLRKKLVYKESKSGIKFCFRSEFLCLIKSYFQFILMPVDHTILLLSVKLTSILCLVGKKIWLSFLLPLVTTKHTVTRQCCEFVPKLSGFLTKVTQIKLVLSRKKQKQSMTNMLKGLPWKQVWDLRELLKCKELTEM